MRSLCRNCRVSVTRRADAKTQEEFWNSDQYPQCPTCAAGTPAQMIPGRDRSTIKCSGCGTVLKSWEEPVVWVDGEPVPVRFGGY